MIYRLNSRLKSFTKTLALPMVGMTVAVAVSATKAWAPASHIQPAPAIVIVLK